MDAYMAYSLCLASSGCVNNLSAITAVRNRFLARHPNLRNVQFTLVNRLPESALNVSVSGPLEVTLLSRESLLREGVVETKVVIQSVNPDCIYRSGKELSKGLEEIGSQLCCRIIIDLCESDPQIVIYGSSDVVEMARVRTLVLLDQTMGLRTDTLELPHYLHHVIAGRRHNQLQSIMEETATNIYLESPFAKTGSSFQAIEERPGTIHLTGDITGISRAKESLRKLAVQKVKSMYHKRSTMHPRKLDWLLLNQQEDLRKLMRDNGSFVAFPPLGSNGDTVTAFAENRINAERALRSLNHLASGVYEATFSLGTKSKGTFRIDDTQQIFGSLDHVSELVRQLSQTSGAEVSYRTETMCFEVFGSEDAIRNVYKMLCTIPAFKQHHHMTVFAVELAADQREFLSGKKNGKVNKIMKSSGVRIKFLAFNEYNFVITLESNDFSKALTGLEMLHDELPAETSFYVPEIYHRRIIGVGGKNIQRVMKRFGVYVKFSGAEEFTALGGYFENEHNVVARTPMKNKANLEHLKTAVMEFVSFQKDRDFVTRTLRIPPHLHRTIPNRHGSQIRDIGRMHNIKVWWPERIGCDRVSIVGPLSLLGIMIHFLSKCIPRETTIPMSPSPALDKLLADQQSIEDIKQRVQQEDAAVKLLIPDTAIKATRWKESSTRVQWKMPYKEAFVFRLRYDQQHEDKASAAKEKLEAAFAEKEVYSQLTLVPVSSSPGLVSPVSGDSCLNIDQEILDTIVSSPPASNNTLKSYDSSSGILGVPLPAFDGSSWSIFPDRKAKASESHLSLDDEPLRAIFENMPSSPPHSVKENNNGSSIMYPVDTPERMRSSAALLLAGTSGASNNIWASPRLQTSNSYSPGSYRGRPMGGGISLTGLSRLQEQPRPYASFSASTSCLSGSDGMLQQQQQQQPSFHQSMPNILFGRDMLPNYHQLYGGAPTPPQSLNDAVFVSSQQQQQQWGMASLPTPPPSSNNSSYRRPVVVDEPFKIPPSSSLERPLASTASVDTKASSTITTSTTIPMISHSSPFPCTHPITQKHHSRSRSPGFNI